MGWFDSVKTEKAKEAVEDLLKAKKNPKALDDWKKKHSDKKESDGYTWWK